MLYRWPQGDLLSLRRGQRRRTGKMEEGSVIVAQSGRTDASDSPAVAELYTVTFARFLAQTYSHEIPHNPDTMARLPLTLLLCV